MNEMFDQVCANITTVSTMGHIKSVKNIKGTECFALVLVLTYCINCVIGFLVPNLDFNWSKAVLCMD